jgi:uncharacterized protein YjiK
MRILILSILSVLTFNIQAQKTPHLKPFKHFTLPVGEPSDLGFSPDGKTMFIASDQGFLYETDLVGNVIRQADYDIIDCEGIFVDDKYVYVAEETTRKIKLFDIKTLKLERTVYLPYSGARNKGYEGLTFNKTRNRFAIVTEKDPIYIFELDLDLRVVNEINVSQMARDISSISYHDNFIWMLSDEDRTVFKVNPNTYEVIAKWIVPIPNPEGLAFDADGNMLIQSDDLNALYFFKTPQN